MSKKTKKQLSEDPITEETPIIFNIPGLDAPPPPPRSRIATLYGDIDQEMASDVISGLYYLRDSGLVVEEEEKTYDPFSMYISTWGGSALDMFAVYDTMRLIKNEGCEIHTMGMGKVMSAGVLLLAGGTKGKRKIGANCRVMLHGVVSGQSGHIHDIENEMEEARWIQRRYIKALSEESDMTQKHIKNLMDRKINVYFDAKEAVEFGIADEII
jgi:ATP-dependent Clp protease, protease subunit|tara:strand:- start:243 stop:881 length:639 start_codon:yes stop_codon:yes gene_type:complete